MPPLHIGCSGWNYRDWRGDFYRADLPARRWLERYAESFDTVEVNATFYRLPTRDAVARWVGQTGADFVFAVKASRYMTHVKRLAAIAEGIEHFYERIGPLADGGKLGPVLWQLPANFQRDDERLEAALRLLDGRGRHAFEFRHESWLHPDVLDRLRAHGIALVIGDHPERRFPSHDATADFVYVRMHYGSRGRDGNYSRRELEAWAERVRGWRSHLEVFVYFNNDWRGFAPRNARDLRRLVDR
ncbi:MAG: DUF72 domain-containing protein [Solirubrobacteraceae bacterium]